MMYSTYSSSIISLRTYSSVNNYSYYSNERYISTCCACCCSFPINSCKLIVPTNPSILYGLRPSTLIQWPPSRGFILGPSDLYRCQSSIYDVGGCCSDSCCVKQDRVDKICKEKCCVREKRIDVNKFKGGIAMPRRDLRSNALGDAEAMLSLLSEDITEECMAVRDKKRRSPLDGKVLSKQNIVIEKLKDTKQNVDSGCIESELKNHQLESAWVRSCEEGHKMKEERMNLSKDEDQRLRRRESSSSYYSFSDSGDFESSMEDEIRQEQLVGESSTSHEMDSRKKGGTVIAEEIEQVWEGYRDEKNQRLRIDTHDGTRVGSSIQRDWRKKSEKKLTEESEETKTRNDYVVRQSQLSQAKESNSVNASSLKKQFGHHNEQAISDVKLFGQSSSHMPKDNRASRYSESSSQHEHSTQKNGKNIETAPSTWRRISQGQDLKIAGMSVQESGCDHCKTCGRSMEEGKTKLEFQRHTKQSEMSTDTKLTTNAESLSDRRHLKHEKKISSLQSSVEEESEQHEQIHQATGKTSEKRKSQHYRETISTENNHAHSTSRATQKSQTQMQNLVEKSRTSAETQSESRLRKEEKSLTSLLTSAEVKNQQHDQIYLATDQVDSRRKSQHHRKVLDTDASYLQSTLRSQQQSETRMKHMEENSASLIATEEVRGLREESGGKETKDIESIKVSHMEIGESQLHSSNLEINSLSAFDKRVYNEETFSKEKVKSVDEVVEKHNWIDESIVHSTLQTEAQGSSTGHFSEDANISRSSVPLISQISQTGVQQFCGEEIKSGQVSMTSPPYHYVNRRSQFREASSSSVKNDMGRTMEVGSGSTHEQPQARTPSSYGKVDDSGGKSSEKYSPEDALASAARMQESSTLIVGEFVEKMSHEASTSETSSKKLEKLDLKYQDEKYMPIDSTQSDIDKKGPQKQGSDLSGISGSDSEKKRSNKLNSKCSSADSGNHRSSDQMWDVEDHFVQEASETTSLEGAASESIVAGRTGKFLWNIVANICRLRRSSHAKTQKSPVKKQSSPSGSASGETWFSGDEVNEANGDDMKTDQISFLLETTSDQSLVRTTRSRKEDAVVMSLNDKTTLADVGASSFSSILKSSSLSGGAFAGGNTSLNVPQHMSLPRPLLDLPKSSPRQLRRSPAFEIVDGAEKDEAPIRSLEEQDDSVDERHTDFSASEGTDAELNRRKLQRSKLVLQRFDEWEDAYRREREQQKVDEIFMREALSEAIKAANSWEVPVGAVLVQNGKIIARGYNLVEELRDSTAHAEMLCIKEASNFLRTWRLSETTLYVTLEPCAMCAGAILQARISTLVWGAPNKLLGADGSWIRLFPEGVEGEKRAEVLDKPAAPVHPFHSKMSIRRGILQEECGDIMQQFFQLKRRKAKEKETPSEEPAQPSCFPKPHHRSKLFHKMHNVFHP